METVASLAVGIAVALATAFFTSRFYVHQAKADLEQEFERRFNDRRWEAYTDFSSTVMDVLQSVRGQRSKASVKPVLRMQEFINRLWLVGSDEVVSKVVDWRTVSRAAEKKPGAASDPLVALAEIIIAMRRDLGERDSDVSARDILATFIDDIDQLLSTDHPERDSG